MTISTPTNTTPSIPGPANAQESSADTMQTDDSPPATSFEQLGVSPSVLQALGKMGYTKPMDVQSRVYAIARAKSDVMVQSQTGSGKTAAFSIPMIENIDTCLAAAQALVLAPTRELAKQVSREMTALAEFSGVTVAPVYGGTPIEPQRKALEEGVHIVVGTPGRVLDHLSRGSFRADNITMLALDECDEMLSMGFQEEIENILEFLPPAGKRHTLLFSATIAPDIERIARRHMVDPQTIMLADGSVRVQELSHCYYVVNGMARSKDLMNILLVENPASALVFCNTRDETSSVAKFLCRHGYDAEALSSDLTQSARERVMQKMRSQSLDILVATDVAARGIDIGGLELVVNYTFPDSPAVYVHRSGRTGRAGEKGICISLIGPREIGNFRQLRLQYKLDVEEREMPSASEMALHRIRHLRSRLASKVPAIAKEQYVRLVKEIADQPDGRKLLAQALQAVMESSPKNKTKDRPKDKLASDPGVKQDSQSTKHYEDKAATKSSSKRVRDGKPSHPNDKNSRKNHRRETQSEPRPSEKEGPSIARLFLPIGTETISQELLQAALDNQYGDKVASVSIRMRAKHAYLKIDRNMAKELVDNALHIDGESVRIEYAKARRRKAARQDAT